MKLVSWNVNGIRSCLKKGFLDFFNNIDADCFCLQETKANQDQVELELPGYHQYWNSAQKKGYSGTAIFTKTEPLRVLYDMNIAEHDTEGRIIALEFDQFFLVNVYTPNSQPELLRLKYRMDWESDFQKYLLDLQKFKPVVLCGDLNVAHQEIDLKNPKTNRRSAGFTNEERDCMTDLLSKGFIDTYRYFYPDQTGAYTWWSYMGKARERNAGWRIDYFLISQQLLPTLKKATIFPEILGSDHCPVGIELI